MASGLRNGHVSLLAVIGITLQSACHCSWTKRSDDYSVTSLEILVQQQAALIQSLQAKLSSVESELRGRITDLENAQPQAVTICPDGWTKFQSSCYTVGTEALTWSEAAEVCERFGGGLAEVGSSEEGSFIRQLGHTHGYSGAWLGGTDIPHEGRWVWVGCKNVIGANGAFADWDVGQPDDAHDQDCVFSKQSYGYRWDDGICTESFAFICELRLNGV